MSGQRNTPRGGTTHHTEPQASNSWQSPPALPGDVHLSAGSPRHSRPDRRNCCPSIAHDRECGAWEQAGRTRYMHRSAFRGNCLGQTCQRVTGRAPAAVAHGALPLEASHDTVFLKRETNSQMISQRIGQKHCTRRKNCMTLPPPRNLPVPHAISLKSGDPDQTTLPGRQTPRKHLRQETASPRKT